MRSAYRYVLIYKLLARTSQDQSVVSCSGLRNLCAFECSVGCCVEVLSAMPLPAPDVPATQRLALDCRTLLDHRGGKGK